MPCSPTHPHTLQAVLLTLIPLHVPEEPIVFFGAGAFGVPTLAELVRRGRVVAIVTQPDKPAGRGGELSPTPIALWAREHAPHVPILKPDKCNTPEVRERIRAFATTTWVVIAFGQKLGQALLADRFAINLHASLLPRWRGAAPINAAMVAGDTRTGNSVITLADRMDAGLVLGTSERDVLPHMTAGELHDLLSSDGPELVLRVLTEHQAGTLRGAAQDESLVTIAPKMSKADGWIDLSQPAARCRERVHGLTPWPGVSAMLVPTGGSEAGTVEAIKLLRVRDEAVPHGRGAGDALDAPRGLFAASPGTALRLLEVQAPGKRAMNFEDFARGKAGLLGGGPRLVSAVGKPASTPTQGGASPAGGPA